jgi:hypothetical protein
MSRHFVGARDAYSNATKIIGAWASLASVLLVQPVTTPVLLVRVI